MVKTYSQAVGEERMKLTVRIVDHSSLPAEHTY